MRTSHRLFITILSGCSALLSVTSAKPAIDPVDPSSIDLTKPTLFIVPYTHLDDIWRWNYPTTIKYFLKNTLDDNFEAFETYPNYVFNWTGADRFGK